LFFVFAASVGLPTAQAQTLGPDFVNDYSVDNLFSVPGVPGPYGGMVFKDGDPNMLLIIGSAEGNNAKIYEIPVTRDAQGHVDGFSGSASSISTASQATGGLMYAPGGVLLFTTYPGNMLGQIMPGSTKPDKMIDLTPLGVGPSTGGIAITPAGFAGAGDFKITSYGFDSWYDADLVPDGGGTFDVANVGPGIFLNTTPGPESIEHVDATYPGFDVQSVIVMEWYNEKVSAYELDVNGDLDPTTRRDFLECCGIFYLGSTTDPVTGDWLIGDSGSGDQVMVVKRNQSNIGTNYCGPAVNNSTGQPGVISAIGSDVVADNDLTLYANQLPVGIFGYYLASETQGFVQNPGGSDGNLCLAGKIGRFVKQVAKSDANGEISIVVDLTQIPVAPPVAVIAGETWNFQCWYRDVGNTSNFTDGLEILFQ
jgi:hypothetical protein